MELLERDLVICSNNDFSFGISLLTLEAFASDSRTAQLDLYFVGGQKLAVPAPHSKALLKQIRAKGKSEEQV